MKCILAFILRRLKTLRREYARQGSEELLRALQRESAILQRIAKRHLVAELRYREHETRREQHEIR